MDLKRNIARNARTVMTAGLLVVSVVGAGIAGAIVANSATPRLEQQDRASAPGDPLDSGGSVDGAMEEEMLGSDAPFVDDDLARSEAGDGGMLSGDGQSGDDSDAEFPPGVQDDSFGDPGESSSSGDDPESDDPGGDASESGPGSGPASGGDDSDPESGNPGGPAVGGPDDGDAGDVPDSSESPSPDPAADATTSTLPVPSAPANRAPTLPARTIELRVELGRRVELFGDTSLAAGWDDPDHTADWLCLEFLPDRRDFWLDGADCTGAGLWTRIQVAGVYVVRIRVFEVNAESPSVAGPRSAEEIVLRLVAG